MAGDHRVVSKLLSYQPQSIEKYFIKDQKSKRADLLAVGGPNLVSPVHEAVASDHLRVVSVILEQMSKYKSNFMMYG